MRDGLDTRANMSACQFYSVLFRDPIHPAFAGILLLAEQLFNIFYLAQRHFSERPGPHVGTGWPAHPMFGKNRVPIIYGSMCVTPQLGLLEGALTNQVVQGDWQYYEFQEDGTEAARKRRKPGWVARSANSTLRFSVSTDIPGNVSVVISYLVSWQHMGQAEVSCFQFCKCPTTQLDGHLTDRKVSVSQTLEFNVDLLFDKGNRTKVCEVEVTVLAATSSEQNKVKLLTVHARGRTS